MSRVQKSLAVVALVAIATWGVAWIGGGTSGDEVVPYGEGSAPDSTEAAQQRRSQIEANKPRNSKAEESESLSSAESGPPSASTSVPQRSDVADVSALGQSEKAKSLAAVAFGPNPEFLDWVDSSFSSTTLDSERARENEQSLLETLGRVFKDAEYLSLIECSDEVCRLEMPRAEYMKLSRAFALRPDVVDFDVFLDASLIGGYRSESGRTIVHLVQKDVALGFLLGES